jgi:thioredoxin 2
MSTIELDDRGLLLACPQCGQRNRLTTNDWDRPSVAASAAPKFDPPENRLKLRVKRCSTPSVRSSKIPVLVEFWPPWCGPCKMVAPELIRVAAEGGLVTKVNTEDLPLLAQRFRVNSIPAFALLKSGREVARQAGAMPAQAIRQSVEKGTG